MGFADRYIHALNATNLKDDERHHEAEPLTAATFAAASLTGDLGPLLHRVKYADGVARKAFEGNAGNLAQLLRLWAAEVTKRGRARRWVPELQNAQLITMTMTATGMLFYGTERSPDGAEYVQEWSVRTQTDR